MALQFTSAEMTDMVMLYGRADGNATEAVRLYQQKFPLRRLPDRRTFINVTRRLRENGNFVDDRRLNARPRDVRNVIENDVLEYFANNPQASTREAANTLGVSNHMVIWRILKQNACHPYHFQKVQDLLPGDYLPREQFASWCLRREQENGLFIHNILFTDEACFTRTGLFNPHNFHAWQQENPHLVRKFQYQHRFSVNVWAGIIDDFLVGPYLMPNRLTGQNYEIFLREVLPLQLEDVPLIIRNRMWFQHDGAPAHNSVAVRRHLDNVFNQHWIGRNGPIAWPARSPDMSPLDFYLWGHMKSMIYETPVESEMELVGRIVAAAGQIKDKHHEILPNVRDSLRRRYQLCVNVQGRHFEHLL